MRNALAQPCLMLACLDCQHSDALQRERGQPCARVAGMTVGAALEFDATDAELRCREFSPDAATRLEDAREERARERPQDHDHLLRDDR